MTSRRNFIIGSGTLLAGSGALLGSGAFGLGGGQELGRFVPIETRTSSSERLSPSLGAGTEAPEGTGDDTDSDGSPVTTTPTGTPPPTPTPVTTPDADDDDDDTTRDRRTSIRLDTSSESVLDSGYILADADGLVVGLSLQDINRDARAYVGETADGRFPNPGAGDRVAFLVVNDGDTAVDLSVEVDGTAPGVLGFPAWVDAGVRGPRQRDLTSVAAEGLQPGGVVHVVVEVDTTRIEDVPPDAVEAVTFVADPV